jgi:hypothetical protein
VLVGELYMQAHAECYQKTSTFVGAIISSSCSFVAIRSSAY